MYILLFLISILSLSFKFHSKKEIIDEEDYYSNRKEKKVEKKEIPHLNYKNYIKKKEILLENNTDIFEETIISEPLVTIPYSQPEIIEEVKQEVEMIVPQKTEEELIEEELEKVKFSGYINNGNLKLIYLTYNDDLLEVRNGNSLKINYNDKSEYIYVSYDERNKILIFYETKYHIEIKREI